MSKKRSKSTEDRSLRGDRSLLAAIDEQLTAAAEEIFWLLKERGQVKMEQLKEQVTERINAAVEIIFTAFGVSRAEATVPEEPHERGLCPEEPVSRPYWFLNLLVHLAVVVYLTSAAVF